jgi:transposase
LGVPTYDTRKEADVMTLVGCDLHARQQQVAVLVTETGEVQERRLIHGGDEVERFYSALPGPVTVGVESTGYALWFHALIQRLGHTLLVGDAAKIRATVVRKTKTDRRDARLILTLLKEDRFPVVWLPDPASRDLRALISHRMRLVRMSTMVKNSLQALALNHRLTLGRKLFTHAGITQLCALPLPPHMAQRRHESLELLTWFRTRVQPLDEQLAQLAAAHPDAQRLMTHPGVGALTALTTVLVLGPVTRFADTKQVASYVGLAPSIYASADRAHLGHITKQGSPLLRSVLGQAGQIAVRFDPDLKRLYYTLVHRRGRSKAKVAVARKLLIRLFIMLRDQIDYAEFRRRGCRRPPICA